MLRRGFLRRSAVRCFNWDGGEKGNRIPNVVAAGTGATPAAFYLGLCRLRGILSPPASATVILQEGRSSAQLRWCCRRAILSCSSDDAASIPKSGLEIKNRCSRGVVAVCRRNHSPLPLRKLESDAALVAATTTAGGPFFSAAKKIRIGRGESLQKAAPAPKAATLNGQPQRKQTQKTVSLLTRG